MLNSLKMLGTPSLSQSCLCIQPLLQSLTKISWFTSVNFHVPIPALIVQKSSLQSQLTLPFSIPQQLLTSQQSTPKNISLPQPFSQFSLCQWTKELRSFVRTDTVLISPFSLKIQEVITGLTITDSISFKLRKFVQCKWQSLMKMPAIRMANHPIHLLSYPLPIVITSVS